MPDRVTVNTRDTAVKPEDPDEGCGCADSAQPTGVETFDGGLLLDDAQESAPKRRAVHPKVGAIALVNALIATTVGVLAWKHVSTPPDVVLGNITLVLDGIVGWIVPSDLW